MDFFNPNSHIDFLRLRRVAVILSAVLMVLALAFTAVRGLNFGLDFTGGTVFEVHFDEAADMQRIRQVLAENEFDDAVAQTFGTSRDVVIRLSPRGREDADATVLAEQVMATLAAGGVPGELKRTDFVGPQVGKELAEDGLIAIIVVMIGIIIYVGLRFQLKFGLAAIACEIHDVVITIGFLALIGIDFNLTVLAAMLAVVGYSINDKIVVFDRIRENFRAVRKADAPEIINRSINQMLSRTIVTSGTTLFTLIALYFLGGAALQGFALTLIFGIVLGTYSSILIAGPILLGLKVNKLDLMPAARDDSALNARP